MNKLLVEITTPGNGKHYEFQLDYVLTVGEAKEMIIREILHLEGNGISLDPAQTFLFCVSSQHLLVETETLETAGMVSGKEYLLL